MSGELYISRNLKVCGSRLKHRALPALRCLLLLPLSCKTCGTFGTQMSEMNGTYLYQQD